jgi:hypothetical protein
MARTPSPAALLAIIALVAFLVAACGAITPAIAPQPLPSPADGPATRPLADGRLGVAPASAPIIAGVPYRFPAYTHCGFNDDTFDFDGSFWRVTGGAEPAGARDGLGDPVADGVIVLLTPDEARWTAESGLDLFLVRMPDGIVEATPCY